MKNFGICGKVFLLSGILFLTNSVFGQDLGSGNSLFRAPNSAAGKSSKSAAGAPRKTAPKKTAAAAPRPAAARPKTSSAVNRGAVKTAPKTAPKTAAARNSAGNNAKTTKTTKSADIVSSDNTVAAENKSTKPIAPLQPTNIVITVGEPTTGEFNEFYERAIEEGNRARDVRNYTQAETAYLRAQSLKAGDSRAIYGLGNLYSDQQRWEEAERAYRTALQLDEKAPEISIALSFVLTQPIAGTNLSGRYKEAETAARRAIELDGENALAYDQLGVALELQGVISQETENAYRRSIKLDPQNALAYAHLGRLLRRLGKTDESTVAYKGAIQLANDVPTMILVADVMQSQQRYLESEQLLRRALREDSRNPTALYMLGRALTIRENYQEAEQVLLKSAEVSPNSFVAYILLGSMYTRQNQLGDAEKSLQKALKVVSPNEKKRLAQEFEAVGDGFARAGKKGDAERAYRQALELGGERMEIGNKLSKLREG